MTLDKKRDLSEEMYHRIYRLIKRDLAPQTIAATLQLPIRTVLGVINRLDKPVSSLSNNATDTKELREKQHDSEFLDLYFYSKTRYAIIQLVGTLSETYTPLLANEIEKALELSWKALAIRMSDVIVLCESACTLIIENKERFTSLGRYLALLDPSPSIEAALTTFHLEGTIPIFGTERAFEDAAFEKKGKNYTRRGNQTSN